MSGYSCGSFQQAYLAGECIVELVLIGDVARVAWAISAEASSIGQMASYNEMQRRRTIHHRLASGEYTIGRCTWHPNDETDQGDRVCSSVVPIMLEVEEDRHQRWIDTLDVEYPTS